MTPHPLLRPFCKILFWSFFNRPPCAERDPIEGVVYVGEDVEQVGGVEFAWRRRVNISSAKKLPFCKGYFQRRAGQTVIYVVFIMQCWYISADNCSPILLIPVKLLYTCVRKMQQLQCFHILAEKHAWSNCYGCGRNGNKNCNQCYYMLVENCFATVSIL